MILSDNETKIDLLNNEAIAKTIVTLLREKPELPVTVGVHGDWGAGKSSLLEMIEASLNAQEGVLCLKFNGWRFQGFEDAKIALIEGIVTGLIEKRPLLTKATDAVRNILHRIDLLKAAKKTGGLALTAYAGLHGLGASALAIPVLLNSLEGWVRAAIRQAIRWQLLLNDPTQGVELPREQCREMSVLTTEQARSFLRTASHSPQACLFAVALTTGMRPSEYLALCWRDIDWDRGTISVVRTLHRNEGQWTFSDTKRVRSRRVVKLQVWVLDLLRKLNLRADEVGPTCDSVFADLIFTTARGEPINEEYLVKKHFKPLLREAGVPTIRLYDLRHTSATLALSVGVAPKVVSEQLGHASAAFTLDTYSHVLPHMQEEAAAKMEAALTNGLSL